MNGLCGIEDGAVFLTPGSRGGDGEKTRGAGAAPLAGVERRFDNIHDAAEWIQVNWPDFDLEYQHPVTWRAEPE